MHPHCEWIIEKIKDWYFGKDICNCCGALREKKE